MKKKSKEEPFVTSRCPEEMVYDGAIAALHGLCVSAGLSIRDGELMISEQMVREVAGIARMAHAIGTRLAIVHLEWCSDGQISREKIDNLSTDEEAQVVHAMNKAAKGPAESTPHPLNSQER